MKPEPFVIERTLNAPVEKVWKAITDKEQMKQWYFDLAEFKPEPGFEFSFDGGTDEKSYVHLCKVTEVVPGKRSCSIVGVTRVLKGTVCNLGIVSGR